MRGDTLGPYVTRVHCAVNGEEVLQTLHDALNDPNIYVFGELMDLERVCSLEATHPHVFRILCAFAFGTIADIADLFDTLSPFQQLKLRQLTIVSLSFSQKVLAYDHLLRELRISNVRELEDIIIDGISRGVFRGKMDQKAKSLLIDETIGRDIKNEEDLDKLIGIMGAWRQRAGEVVHSLHEETEFAHQKRLTDLSHSMEVKKKIQDGLNMIAISEAAAEVRGGEERYVETSKKRSREYR